MVQSLDNTDPQINTDLRETKPNVGLAMMFYSENYYVAVSTPELTINVSNSNAPQNATCRNRYYFTGACIIALDDDINLKPATLVTYSKTIPTPVDVSTIRYVKNTVGVGFKHNFNKQMAGILSININPCGWVIVTCSAQLRSVLLATPPTNLR